MFTTIDDEWFAMATSPVAAWLRRNFLVDSSFRRRVKLTFNSGADVSLAVSASVPNRMTIILKCIIFIRTELAPGVDELEDEPVARHGCSQTPPAADTPSQPSLETSVLLLPLRI